MNHIALIKYALYGVLGAELGTVGVEPWWFLSIVLTVIVIENLSIIQSRRS